MKVHFNKEVVGKQLPERYGDTGDFRIFRYAEINKGKGEPEGWFVVKFTLKNMHVRKNKFFSKLPMLVLFNFKGFCSKYWLMDEKTNTCMGVYRWQTKEDAQNYSHSIAMKFMSKRSVPGSVKYHVGKGTQPVCVF